MGGQIGVTSKPDQGSTFWFELPLTVSANPRPILPANEPVHLTKNRLAELTILVVDDSASIRDLIATFLRLEGAEVEQAADGAQALALLQDHGSRFDCVMMDVQMPVMDGLSATQNIRAITELDHLPVLAMTAGLLAEQQARARQAGMADVVAKPVDVDRMIVQILTAVGRANPTAGSQDGEQNPMPVIAGIDRDAANITMDGNRRLYDRLLVVFVQEFDGLDEHIANLLDQGLDPATIVETRRLAHGLRGAASQIGATEVSEAAGVLERALATDPKQGHAKCQIMGKLLGDLMYSLKRYLKTLHAKL